MINKLLDRKKLNPSIPIFTGTESTDEISMQLFIYNPDSYIEDDTFSEINFNGFPKKKSMYWLNIHGIHDEERISKLCSMLNIHTLAVQDILDVNQRPKFQEYEEFWFFSLKSIIPSDSSIIEKEQLSFILGSNFLISFQERKADYFNHIRERIRKKIGRVRDKGPDYLLFLLIESILDNYFESVTGIESNIENLIVLDIERDPSPNIIKSIELYKRHIHVIKKTVAPIKDFITKMEREKFNFVEDNNVKYYFEAKDLCLSLIDSCEHLEVKLESSINHFFSIQGHRSNQVMKTLTIVATIFIPLTFLVGIYGMNFSYMPELNLKWGYFGVWVIMFLILLGMIQYFKQKKWF